MLLSACVKVLQHKQLALKLRALTLKTPAEATKGADVVMIVTPDEHQADVYKNESRA
jgi:ketol-acid reductoisomerase